MHRLFVHSDIWRKLGVDVGDVVEVEIEPDDEEWEITVPADLAEAMPEGSEAWRRFRPSPSPTASGSSTASRRPRPRQLASGASNRASNCSSSDCEGSWAGSGDCPIGRLYRSWRACRTMKRPFDKLRVNGVLVYLLVEIVSRALLWRRSRCGRSRPGSAPRRWCSWDSCRRRTRDRCRPARRRTGTSRRYS